MSHTLVLNASYEPLAVVSTRRAILLLLGGKASTVTETTAKVRSATLSLNAPSVVLLNHFVRVPRRTVPLTRKSALARYGHVCAYCGRYGDTLDHVVPRSRGGAHDWRNVLIACFRCNNRKADFLLSELGWTLPFELKPPDPAAVDVIAGRSQPGWDEYTRPWNTERIPIAG
ncbi:HNH endonuclease [Agromyces mediolanus]|uniref:HNH endonuclease n=1 Tax=Agromyces mediolanus TaxID=41986 RepID=A0A918F8V3_AGRME|nr:HNH endonuclease [Agromyces mediolanus]GGR16643.1 HNH endonuclease [Agromyces mediolanus]GLJ73658.1 HNH endonuclease [Agromyces mediolanus]